MKKETIIKLTKYILDFMFFGGIVVTVTLPFSIKFLEQYIERMQGHYGEIVIIYFVLGIAAVKIIWELRKIFKTVIDKNCFVQENVMSLDKMCK